MFFARFFLKSDEILFGLIHDIADERLGGERSSLFIVCFMHYKVTSIHDLFAEIPLNHFLKISLLNKIFTFIQLDIDKLSFAVHPKWKVRSLGATGISTLPLGQFSIDWG